MSLDHLRVAVQSTAEAESKVPMASALENVLIAELASTSVFSQLLGYLQALEGGTYRCCQLQYSSMADEYCCAMDFIDAARDNLGIRGSLAVCKAVVDLHVSSFAKAAVAAEKTRSDLKKQEAGARFACLSVVTSQLARCILLCRNVAVRPSAGAKSKEARAAELLGTVDDLDDSFDDEPEPGYTPCRPSTGFCCLFQSLTAVRL